MADTTNTVAWIGAGGLAATGLLGILATSVRMGAEARRERRAARLIAFDGLIHSNDEFLRACGVTWSGEVSAKDVETARRSTFDEPPNYRDLEQKVLDATTQVRLVGSTRVVRQADAFSKAMRDLLTHQGDSVTAETLTKRHDAYYSSRLAFTDACRKDLRPWHVWR